MPRNKQAIGEMVKELLQVKDILEASTSPTLVVSNTFTGSCNFYINTESSKLTKNGSSLQQV